MLLITTLFFTVYNTQKYFVNLVTNYFVVVVVVTVVELHKEKEGCVHTQNGSNTCGTVTETTTTH